MGNYVTKRPNAFKLFSKEQRSKVMAELPDKPITDVNKILRQKVKTDTEFTLLLHEHRIMLCSKYTLSSKLAMGVCTDQWMYL